MPLVGVKVSLNTEMQKFLQEKTVTPSPGQYPRMTAGSAQVSAASVTWTNAEPDTMMERVLAPANLSVRINVWSATRAHRVPMA